MMLKSNEKKKKNCGEDHEDKNQYENRQEKENTGLYRSLTSVESSKKGKGG